MKSWNNRATEIAFLLNPAFCGRIIYHSLTEYSKERGTDMPYPLVYLILPLVLHKKTRLNITSRTQMQIWIQKYPELVINFPERARDLIGITNEAIEFLLQTNCIKINDKAELESKNKTMSKTQFTDDEIQDCIKKSEHVGRWFARAGTIETIYSCWGVRP